MIGIVELCAIQFLAQEPIPEKLQEIYKKTYQCEKFIPLQRTLAQEKIENVNKYFPIHKSFWPLIVNPLEKDSSKLVDSWLKQGVTPGFLLPKKITYNLESFKKFKELYKMGAIPIATLENTSVQTMTASRYYWCMHGSCPSGWYLENGINGTIENAPKSLYISANHWINKKNLPLPDRMFQVKEKQILPWSQVKPVSSIAESSSFSNNYYFVPEHYEKWQWLGVDFVSNHNKIETTIFGNIMLIVGEASFVIWDKINSLNINIFSLINENFSWIAVFIAVLNILLMIKSIIKKRQG